MPKRSVVELSGKKKVEILSDVFDEMGENVLLADGFEDAIIGRNISSCGHQGQAVIYDWDLCVEILIYRDNMTYEEAVEYLDFNTLGAYVGETTPIFIQRVEEI